MFFKPKEKTKENDPENKPAGFRWPWPNPLDEYGQQRMNDHLRLLAKDAFFVSLSLFLIFSWFEWRNPGISEGIFHPKSFFVLIIFSMIILLQNKITEQIIIKLGRITFVAFILLLIKDFLFFFQLKAITTNNILIWFDKNTSFFYLTIFIIFILIFYKNIKISRSLSIYKKDNSKENKTIKKFKIFNYKVLFLIIISLGFLLRLIGAIYGNIDLDEGIHLYDAKLINEGLIPFYDFLTREPFYVYSLSVFVKIFGQSLLTSRMVSVVAFTLSAIVIFFLGKRIFDKKVALTAATLFLLSPYLIYNSYLGNLYGTYTLISSLFFLFFAELLLPDKPKKTNLILSGLLLGSAVHFYRIAVFYFPVVGFIWGFYIISKLHKKYFLLFLFSIFLPFILPLIYFSKKVGYGNFEIIYGTNELIISFLSLIIFFLFGVFLKKFFTKLNNDFKNKLISYFILLIIIFILYSFFNIGLDSSKKTKIIADMFLQNWFIFLFILINGLYLINHFSIEESLSSFLRLLIITVLGILLYYGFYESASLNNFGARPIQPALKKIFFWPFLFSLTMTFFITNKKQKFTSEGGIIYWWLIMLSPIIFYTIHVQINVNNFLAFSVLGSIMAAHGFWVTINNFEKLEKNISKTMAVSLLVIFVIPILIYTKIPLRDRLYTQEFKKEIEIYLIKNTKKNEEIFTNALVFPVETGRKSFMNLSRAFIYASSPIYMPEYIGTSSNLLPSNVLADKLRKECDVILMDHRTTAILKTNEYFKDLEDCYYKDKEWIEYGISLWRKDKNLCN